jgi:hypothetical protein
LVQYITFGSITSTSNNYRLFLLTWLGMNYPWLWYRYAIGVGFVRYGYLITMLLVRVDWA